MATNIRQPKAEKSCNLLKFKYSSSAASVIAFASLCCLFLFFPKDKMRGGKKSYKCKEKCFEASEWL